MSDTLKEFQRKVRNRKFAMDNSWKSDFQIHSNSGCEGQWLEDHGQLESDLPWDLLNDNLAAADACKYFDGYLPLSSNRRYLGKWIVLAKRIIRKLLKIFMGWYIFPQYQRMSHFNGKVVNAMYLERDILLEAVKQNQHISQTIIQLESQFIDKLDQLSQENAELNQQKANLELNIQELQNKLQKVIEDNEQLHIRIKKIENLPTDDDEFYHDFEEKFRGSQDDIRERLRVYVPKVKQYLEDWSHGTFVDVGSGRGEWLDILRENGASDYVGIDLNVRQNAICAEKGHPVLQMDCIEYLASLPENSVDLVTGFQIIEHLCMSDLMALLKESYRVLKKRGMILFETQNPHNIIVGATSFYTDPSHKRPLEPNMVVFLAESCGYSNVGYIGVNEDPECKKLILKTENKDMIQLVDELNNIKQLLYGPRDYAIFAVKE